jgi:hypothetical protein
MNWQEAKVGTIEQWLGIRESINSEDEVRILTEINAVCDLCDIARAEAPGPEERCDHCHFYQQFGGCQEVSWKMTERVTEHDWDGLRGLVDEFIARLRLMDQPAEGEAATGS